MRMRGGNPLRLTPKQAEAVASLIKKHPGEAVSFAASGAGREIGVAFNDSAVLVGGRGKITRTK
jgi:hypothetical protein